MIDNNILEFVRSCIKDRKILWRYHVNMRMKERFISREDILSSVNTFEIIEKYPKDKYIPSYLIYAVNGDRVIHIQIAINRHDDIIIIITAYKPTLDKWEKDFKTRRNHDLS